MTMIPFAVALLASIARPALAQIVGGIDVTSLPKCAQGCLAGNTGAASGCAITDVHCLCTSIPYINALYCCLQRDCTTDEQKSALSFNIALCDQFNVTIPDFLGCSPLSSSSNAKSSTYSIPTSLPSVVSVSSTSNVSTITEIKPAFTMTDGGPLAEFSPRALLTGSCAVPAIASTTLNGGVIQEYPWVGCFTDQPDCCAFSTSTPGPISVCPQDFTTTSGACCPSGWDVYSSALAGQTPCVTTPAIPMVPSKPKSSAGSPSITAISDQLFTLRYTLQNPPPSGLSGGAIGGIVVGAVAGIALISALIFFILRRRRQKAQAIRDATITRSANDTVQDMSPTSPMSKYHTALSVPGTPGAAESAYSPSELPSPPVGATPGGWGKPASPSLPPVEMPGSTYIHEHHPAFGSMPEASGVELESGPPVLKPLAANGPGEAYRPPFASVDRLPGGSTTDLTGGGR